MLPASVVKPDITESRSGVQAPANDVPAPDAGKDIEILSFLSVVVAAVEPGP